MSLSPTAAAKAAVDFIDARRDGLSAKSSDGRADGGRLGRSGSGFGWARTAVLAAAFAAGAASLSSGAQAQTIGGAVPAWTPPAKVQTVRDASPQTFTGQQAMAGYGQTAQERADTLAAGGFDQKSYLVELARNSAREATEAGDIATARVLAGTAAALEDPKIAFGPQQMLLAARNFDAAAHAPSVGGQHRADLAAQAQALTSSAQQAVAAATAHAAGGHKKAEVR